MKKEKALTFLSCHDEGYERIEEIVDNILLFRSRESFDSIEFADENGVTVSVESYYCGDYEYATITFPSEYLWMENEEIKKDWEERNK